MELNSIPRSASNNRFQVNPVNHKNEPVSDGNNGLNDDDDKFYEAQFMQKKTSIQIQPRKKSSIRDKGSQSHRRETRTSFQVAPHESDDSDNEEDNLIDQDTKYGRSFR